ncbi:hypothetical protein RIR_jg22622.t2 [Rhizophagus irregularis DAOM 181602=DAOM 197198]|nr:hypothetical protein RIR_jg22622.t2 [Rhizophagus irregularis DAOM 181602=DAOM 197198]
MLLKYYNLSHKIDFRWVLESRFVSSCKSCKTRYCIIYAITLLEHPLNKTHTVLELKYLLSKSTISIRNLNWIMD